MEEITIRLKERFCKDNNLNIRLYQEPYFMERLKLYDKKFNTLEKWNQFLNDIEEFKTDEEYFAYYNNVKDTVINYIKSQPAFENFRNDNFNKYKVKNYNIPSSNIFHESNNNKSFISIDLKKGCYSALRYFDKSIVANTDSYEEFLSKFTNKQSIINSKYIRQVIFGNCIAGRQTTVEKYMMSLMMDKLQELNLNFAGYTDDEIIICYDEKAKKSFDKIKEIVYKVTKENDFDVHFEVFNIERIKKSDVYVKNFLDKKEPEIKCANHLTMPFVLRILNDELPTPNDFVFYENKNLAILLELRELEISNESLDFKINKFKDTAQPIKNNDTLTSER